MNYMVYEDDKKYINRIRELREDNDYTQEYIAHCLDTSQTMYARYERDASAMPIRHLIYLSKLYNVSTDYILGLTDTKSTASQSAYCMSPCNDAAATLPASKLPFHWDKDK